MSRAKRGLESGRATVPRPEKLDARDALHLANEKARTEDLSRPGAISRLQFRQ